MNQRQFDRDGIEGDDFDIENDPEDGYNWVNNPIRRFFDNPKQSSHVSFLAKYADYERPVRPVCPGCPED